MQLNLWTRDKLHPSVAREAGPPEHSGLPQAETVARGLHCGPSTTSAPHPALPARIPPAVGVARSYAGRPRRWKTLEFGLAFSFFSFLLPSLSRTGYGPGLLCACWELAGIVGTHCGGRAVEPSPKRTCLSTPVFSFQSRLAQWSLSPTPKEGSPTAPLASPPPDGNLCVLP